MLQGHQPAGAGRGLACSAPQSDWWPPALNQPPMTLERREETGPGWQRDTVGLQGLLRMVVIAAVVLREQILDRMQQPQ